MILHTDKISDFHMFNPPLRIERSLDHTSGLLMYTVAQKSEPLPNHKKSY